MTQKRPKTLKWVGNMFPDGRPEWYFDWLPIRDLTEAETDVLTQDQLTAIRHSDLYREVHDKPARTIKSNTSTTITTPHKFQVPGDTTENEPADEPDTAATPATESEE